MPLHRFYIFVLLPLIAVGFGCDSYKPQPPTSIPGVRVDEHPNAQLPLNATFEDENARIVRLGDYFETGKPVILQLAYYRCPNLCTLVSKGIVDSLKELTLKMGSDFSVVEISIDPKETSSLACQKKQTSMAEFSKTNRSLDPAAWHFLVGRRASIEKLADAVGFRYLYMASSDQYAHPAVIMICTPGGRVSRYLYGVKYPSSTLRLSLVEASEGKIGSTVDRLILTCFHFDPNSGKYVVAAVRLMQIAAALTVLVLALAIWRWNRKARKKLQPATSQQQMTNDQ